MLRRLSTAIKNTMVAPTASLSARGRTVTFNTKLFINNEWVDGTASEPIVSIDPATEKPIATVHSASAADVDRAVKAARQSFETTWGINVSGPDRARMVNKLADLIEQNSDDLAILETYDCGKPFQWSKSDMCDVVACLRYYAGWADKLHGQTIDTSHPLRMAMTRHEPVGVVGQIVPWNYPASMASWKFAPALACGCSIVFKPAEITPLSMLKIAEYIKEAGFPAGAFNLVQGLGTIAGQAIADHMDIDKIAFTGSTAVGKNITIAAAKSNLKKVTLELGGKSPNVIFPSADIDQAAKWACFGALETMGQSCSAGTRILVHKSIKKEFQKAFIDAVKAYKVGDPWDDDTFQGPQVSAAQRDKVMHYVKLGKSEGATLLTGGNEVSGPGYFIEPTIYADVTMDMKIAQDEIFGPCIVLIDFETEEEAIKIANDTSYGLGSGLHSKDADQIMRVGQQLKAGTVWINNYTILSNSAPFGGYKQSGWGRELGSYGLEEYQNVKTYHWNFGEPIEWPMKLRL